MTAPAESKLINKAAYVKATASPLTAMDRCDRCASQAYAQAFFADVETPLMFCKHHMDAHLDQLKAQAIHIHDYTSVLKKG